MNGRLGMTGSGVDRGDSAVNKALRFQVQNIKDLVPRTPHKAGKSRLGYAGYAGMGSVSAIGSGFHSMSEPTKETVAGLKQAYKDKGFKTTSGKSRKLGKEEIGQAIRHEQVRHHQMNDTFLSYRSRAYQSRNRPVSKVDTTMADHEANRLADKYDTRGPLPKGLDRATKMKAYEARYIASGGRRGEKWKRRADASEVVRNIGLASATGSAAAILASRGKRIRPLLKKTPILRRVSTHHVESAGLAGASIGGGAELYGEHARHKRASYQNSPAGVAGSALSRMQGYTPGAKQ